VEQHPATPPEDADDWSNEQWIEWLTATDTDSDTARPLPTALDRIVHTTGGQLVGNAMLGLSRALYGKEPEKPAIVVEASEPDGERLIQVHLDFDHPDK